MEADLLFSLLMDTNPEKQHTGHRDAQEPGRSERPLVLMLTQCLSLYNAHRDFQIRKVPQDKNMSERVQYQTRTSGTRPGQSPFLFC